MTRPIRLHLVLLLGSAIVLALALYATRPRCTCVLGGNYDESAPGWTVPEDCPKHGRIVP